MDTKKYMLITERIKTSYEEYGAGAIEEVFSIDQIDLAEDALNEFASDGWRVIAVTAAPFTFKDKEDGVWMETCVIWTLEKDKYM